MLRIHVANLRQSEVLTDIDGPVILGRRAFHENARALVIHDDQHVSRAHLLVDPKQSKVLLKNLSSSGNVQILSPEQIILLPGDQAELPLPVRAQLGGTMVDIESALEGEAVSMAMATIAAPVQISDVHPLEIAAGTAPSAEMLLRWFEQLIHVQRSAAGSDEFYSQTARAVVELIGVDCGMVLLRKNDSWKVVARHDASDALSFQYSERILRKVVQDRLTVYQLDSGTSRTESLRSVESLVASPILDANDNVIGVVYGVRSSGGSFGSVQIRPLEAQLVQVLAAATAAGLARQESGAAAMRRHVQFEQFVSPEVVRELDRNPQLLDGHSCAITALFVDIRNFSALSERLDAGRLIELVRSIMERLTGRVREFGGTTVSYLGDGLLAMWNAPVAQGNHASLACQAALGMLDDLPKLNEQWQATVGGPLGIGVGINTGLAMVGNTGSLFKPQYGPLGHTVNLASRVEGATKKLGVPILITGTTRSEIGNAFPTRRLCRVRVVGINEPVDLFELHAVSADATWRVRRDQFESALEMFEAARWEEVCSTVFPLLRNPDNSHDGPSLSLLSRAVECLKSPPDRFDPVWDLRSK